jgi:hypothetical protein
MRHTKNLQIKFKVLFENYRRVMEDALKQDGTGANAEQATEDVVMPGLLGK